MDYLLYMEKIVKLTESHLVEIIKKIISEQEDGVEITSNDDSQKIVNKVKDLKEKLNQKERVLEDELKRIRPLRQEISELSSQIKFYEKYYIPKIFLMPILNKQTGTEYLKAVVRYYVDGIEKQQATTVHVGKLSDFPMGINDPKAKKIAFDKAWKFISSKRDKL